MNILYTAPTAIRAFIKGVSMARETDQQSAFVGTVCEPINLEAGCGIARSRRGGP